MHHLCRGVFEDAVDLCWAPDGSCLAVVYLRSGQVQVVEVLRQKGSAARGTATLKPLVSLAGCLSWGEKQPSTIPQIKGSLCHLVAMDARSNHLSHMHA